jgi:hypothetical protein
VSSGLLVGGVHPLTFAARLGDLRALVAGIGDPCWAFGSTSLALQGVEGCPLEPPFHLLTLRGRHVTRIGHVIHTTVDLPKLDRTEAFGLPVTSATRAIVDVARTESMEHLTATIASATGLGLTSEDFLHRRLVALRGSGHVGIGRLLDSLRVIETTSGAQSWLERTFLTMLAARGLPRPVTQQVLGRRRNTLVRVDCRFPGTPVVVELLGYCFHRTVMQMQTDTERLNELVFAGLEPFQFTYLHVVEDPAFVLTTVRRALAPHLAGIRART